MKKVLGLLVMICMVASITIIINKWSMEISPGVKSALGVVGP
jgi:hypothetical protein